MLDHPPGEPGMCARESWQALGGDQNPPNPPAWGTPNANAVYNEIVESGRYWTIAPRSHGVRSSPGSTATTVTPHCRTGTGRSSPPTPRTTPGAPGSSRCRYPERWGATSSKRIYTDTYNGVQFEIEGSTDHGPVYLSKLRYGQQDSDSVRRLQMHLNGHPLQNGQELPITGNYLDDTDEEVRLCQAQHGYGSDAGGAVHRRPVAGRAPVRRVRMPGNGRHRHHRATDARGGPDG